MPSIEKIKVNNKILIMTYLYSFANVWTCKNKLVLFQHFREKNKIENLLFICEIGQKPNCDKPNGVGLQACLEMQMVQM